MKGSGSVLQFIGVTIGVIGGLAGFVQLTAPRSNNGFLIVVSSLIAGVLLYEAGTAIQHLAFIATNAQRSADANERAAEALEALTRRQRATAPPYQQPVEEKAQAIRPPQTDAPSPSPSNTARVLRKLRTATDPPDQEN